MTGLSCRDQRLQLLHKGAHHLRRRACIISQFAQQQRWQPWMTRRHPRELLYKRGQRCDCISFMFFKRCFDCARQWRDALAHHDVEQSGLVLEVVMRQRRRDAGAK